MSKLFRACSPLYRRQILQETIRWKALEEIHKIYTYASLGEKNRIENEIMNMFAHFCTTPDLTKEKKIDWDSATSIQTEKHIFVEFQQPTFTNIRCVNICQILKIQLEYLEVLL